MYVPKIHMYRLLGSCLEKCIGYNNLPMIVRFVSRPYAPCQLVSNAVSIKGFYMVSPLSLNLLMQLL